MNLYNPPKKDEKMTFGEYFRLQNHEFTIEYNDFLVAHTIQITYDNDCVTIKILDLDNSIIAFIVFNFNIQNEELHIKYINVNDKYTRQSIGTFLIILSLEFVYRYTNIIELSAMVITVTLDDMSSRSRKINNMYIFAGFHYEERDSSLPDMLSSLIHTIRICEYYFKSKSKLNTKPTIFNKNHKYFLGGKMKIRSNKSLHYEFKKKKFKISTGGVHDSEKHEHDIIYVKLYNLRNNFSVLKFLFPNRVLPKVLMNGGKRNSTKLYTKKDKKKIDGVVKVIYSKKKSKKLYVKSKGKMMNLVKYKKIKQKQKTKNKKQKTKNKKQKQKNL